MTIFIPKSLNSNADFKVSVGLVPESFGYISSRSVSISFNAILADSIINLKYQTIEIIDIDKLQSQC